jgi:hypothetical protein
MRYKLAKEPKGYAADPRCLVEINAIAVID